MKHRNTPTPKQRAADAQRALRAYAQLDGSGPEAHATRLADLLADLRHFADHHGLNYIEEDARAYGHYTYEISGHLPEPRRDTRQRTPRPH